MFDTVPENLQGAPVRVRQNNSDSTNRHYSADNGEANFLQADITDDSATPPGAEAGTAPERHAESREPSIALSPELLAGERDRIVRICLRFTGGNSDIAEDLAQETLMEALRSRSQIRSPEAWRAWLAGIARNICLRWARRHTLEQERLLRLPDRFGGDAEEALAGNEPTVPGVAFGSAANGFAVSPVVLVAAEDLDAALEHQELAYLLDRAMNRIPVRMRELLIEHYVDDLPQAEIAARRGIREETVAVQMHRGRKALRDVLVAPDMRRDAAELGLIADASAPWQETHIWCPECGRRRMVGKFNTGEQGPGEVHEFVLKCPDCHGGEDAIPFTTARLDDNARYAEVLRGVKGFKPALNRISNMWLHHCRTALQKGVANCVLCNERVPVQITAPPDMVEPGAAPRPAFFYRCHRCGTLCFVDVDMYSLWQPETQTFWRNHPRIRVLPTREVTTTSGASLLTRIESVTTSEVLDIITARDTLQVIEIVNGNR